MERKVLNNKVKFYAGCKEVVIKLSDKELQDLRNHTNYNFTKGVARATLLCFVGFFGLRPQKKPFKGCSCKGTIPLPRV